MGDLLLEYFRRDLDFVELDQLEELLEGPEENAARFAENAAAFYRSLGLPEAPPRRFWRAWKVFLALGLGLGLAALGWYWSQSSSPAMAPAPPLQQEVPSAQESPRPTHKARPRSSAPPRASPVSAAPKPRFDLLAVTLNLVDRRQVDVLVLDVGGRAVRRLYRGQVGAGHWTFSWDGRIDDAAAPAGIYAIEVRSGTYVQRKQVKIEAKIP